MEFLINLVALVAIFESSQYLCMKHIYKVHPDRARDFRSAYLAGAISFYLAVHVATALTATLMGSG